MCWGVRANGAQKMPKTRTCEMYPRHARYCGIRLLVVHEAVCHGVSHGFVANSQPYSHTPELFKLLKEAVAIGLRHKNCFVL